ncbi:M81 family metallopeptidase [Capnocytophaga sp.]|uniref:M81 family metallopeptidase n=1 Tax=Capnocytophaga sp. TaxID=44737 RepID=UPI0026DAA7D9|nr:M81 family metallopeptidase [Capnocytophaga sp.]MDO5105065.1 M81 family metallopeptidase [Capnocytophaga sp.]
MKKTLYSLLILGLFSLTSCQETATPKKLPRVAIAGIAIESSTFSPAVSREDAFPLRIGDSIFSYYNFFVPDSGVVQRADWVPTLRSHAMPGGIVERETYEKMVTKTLEMLKASLPIDGLFFDIHGAMSVQGLEDPEGDLIVRIREVIGNDVLVSSCMDLHGSVSPRLAQNIDMITCYRLAPHEDAMISKKRALTNLLDRLESGKGKPAYKAWVPVPILLPGEKTSTRIEPAKSLYGQIPSLIDGNKVIDASIWMSYPWADEPRNHGVIMTYGDDKEAVGKAAETLAKHFWDVRDKFEFVAPTAYLPECLSQALASTEKPFIISDMGDNPTAGGAGDVTWTLTELFKRPEFKNENGKQLIYASIPDADFVKQALAIGVGGKIDAAAGAKVDNRYAPPVRIAGTITTIEKDEKDNTIVVVKSGGISVIVTEKRKAYHLERYFTELGLNPREADILVVKIGYLVPELYNMRKGWVMALTPGGVDQDLMRLPYKNIQRPMYPLDADMPEPNLKARFVPLATEPPVKQL